MGEFAKRVRLDINVAGHVPGPLQRKFTAERWRLAFEGAGVLDDEDKRLYAAALAIHQKLNSIRARQRLSTAESLSATTKLRCFVAAANHQFILVGQKTQKEIATAGAARAKACAGGFNLEELANVLLTLPSGMEATPNSLVEGLVDGIETPIGVALSVSPELSGNPRMNEVEWSDIALEINLGVFFRYAQDVWDDCLWNDYRMVEREGLKYFVPGSREFQRAHVCGIARRQALAMGFNIFAMKAHQELVASGRLFNVVREVSSIERRGKRQIFRVSKLGEETAAQSMLTVLRAHASEPYYQDLLSEQAPKLNGLTLNDVLTAWTVVSRACQLLMDSISIENVVVDEAEAPPHTWLPQFAPVLQVDALIAALGTTAGFGPLEARKLIDFFTFRGERDREIWAQPLVPVGKSTLAPVFAAIVSPNLRRLVDIWMRQAGVDLAKRGEPFEAHIRAVTREAIAESKLLSGAATSISESYTFTPPKEASVQFDLLFFIGRTVFVGEAKCVLEPTEAKAVAMHRKTVCEAADQALLRVGVLDANRSGFVADLKRRFDIELDVDFKAVPLVIVSTCTHVGVPAKSVAVIDEFILERFIAGELEDVAVRGGTIDVLERVKTLFYADSSEAEARGPSYFEDPPQMARFKGGVGEELFPFPSFNEGDWEGAVVALYCRPNDGLPGFASVSAAADVHDA